MATLRFHFRGQVQGVFFRKTTAEIAKRFPVTGSVRNLDDGSVEVLAQGDLRVVEDFAAAIRQHFQNNITEVTHADLPEAQTWTRFEIQY